MLAKPQGGQAWYQSRYHPYR
ncbi:hypothetical protein D044_3658A, partial [Vibrio parahaemolyticus EKP-026]